MRTASRNGFLHLSRIAGVSPSAEGKAEEGKAGPTEGEERGTGRRHLKVILLAMACESQFSFLSLGPRHCHCTLLSESSPYTRRSEVFWIKVCLMLIAIDDETKKRKMPVGSVFSKQFASVPCGSARCGAPRHVQIEEDTYDTLGKYQKTAIAASHIHIPIRPSHVISLHRTAYHSSFSVCTGPRHHFTSTAHLPRAALACDVSIHHTPLCAPEW